MLLFALVLGLAALAAAVSPSRDSGPAVVPAPAPAPAREVVPRTVAFDAQAGPARERRVAPGEHVLVSVSSGAGGVATIPQLGRTGTVSPAAPAQFDLLAPGSGRYDVMVETAGSSEPRRVGTLVVRP
jgi:hypothetical protein